MKFTIKDRFIFGSFLFALFLLVVYIINSYAYFNPLSLCHIKISGDVLRGNEDTIRGAISIIRKEDKETYRDLCKYVDRINEMFCMGADPRRGASDRASWDEYGMNKAGCYVRGSRVIYIQPSYDKSDTTVNERVETIKKYTQYSKNYWTNK